jgi:signal transduction histidine kinase/ActR/RegA family two-component response regulator
VKSVWCFFKRLQVPLSVPLSLSAACFLALIFFAHMPPGHLLEFSPAGTASAKAGGAAAHPARWVLSWLAVAAAASAVAAVAHAVQHATKPTKHLVEVARAITHGHWRTRARVEGAGDFRLLAEAFNQMIDARQSAEEKLRTAHDSLELKISARTAELWRANKALQEESEQRVRAEREFYQAQKMEALGKLAGSIAHDFNNLLTVIIGGAECVRKQIGENHVSAQLLRTVEQAAERAAGLTRPLLTFSRNQVASSETLSLNAAAEEAGRMLQRLLGVNIEFRLELEPELRSIKANSTQIQQVLINLGVNARDAMEGIGRLTFRTRNVKVDGETIRRHGVGAAERWVELAVADTGSGMDAATKARVFEPFFTTKPAGHGTGLGLATVFGIVKQSGGFIELESEPGSGTTFRVFLPAVAAEAPAPSQAATPADVAPRTPGEETLLLVDDEDDIRELATMMLEERGYRILSAPNAQEAIALGEKHAGEISALITDVLMPGMTGVQLAEVLTRIIPGLRVLFVSGHSNESISSETLAAVSGDYLQKPYLSDALATKVRQVLTAREPCLATPVMEAWSGWNN